MFKVPWIFIPISIIYFIIITIIAIILFIKYILNYFKKQLVVDMKKICEKQIKEIKPITPFKNIFEFDRNNASSLLTLNLDVSIWSGCQDVLPNINNFNIVETYEGYDYAAGFNRNIAALYYSKILNIAIISFSGTMYLTEWANDFDFSQTNPNSITGDNNILVHEKDYIMYNTFRNNFLSTIKKIKNDTTTLVVTGHSLGGALATICFLDVISNNIIPVGFRTLYTFGAPRVGNIAFADIINKEKAQFRVVNTEDIITDLPLPIDGNKIYEQTITNSGTVFSLNLGDYESNHINSYIEFLK